MLSQRQLLVTAGSNYCNQKAAFTELRKTETKQTYSKAKTKSISNFVKYIFAHFSFSALLLE